MAANPTSDDGSIDVKDKVIPEAPAPKQTIGQTALRILNPMNYPSHVKKLFKKITGVIGKWKK